MPKDQPLRGIIKIDFFCNKINKEASDKSVMIHYDSIKPKGKNDSCLLQCGYPINNSGWKWSRMFRAANVTSTHLTQTCNECKQKIKLPTILPLLIILNNHIHTNQKQTKQQFLFCYTTNATLVQLLEFCITMNN